jgi:hypothetical protein
MVSQRREYEVFCSLRQMVPAFEEELSSHGKENLFRLGRRVSIFPYACR